MGPAAIALELAARWLCEPTLDLKNFLTAFNQNGYLSFLNIILFAPIIEEHLKYAVVKRRILKDPVFDEPLDAMLYLIISALGFAAIENLLNILLAPGIVTLKFALSQAIARFLSATFLHTLASGMLGYFLALSLLHIKKRRILFLGGFILAVSFHSLYNYLAWLIDTSNIFVLVLALSLVAMGIIITWQFYDLKKKLSICKLR